MPKLTREFFTRPVEVVAQGLLGQELIFGSYHGVITETEGYGGDDDPASHAFRGPTSRTKVMFGVAGISYVYLIYGMYYCLNIVTGTEGTASAVLIRGLKLIKPKGVLLNGPGKLCRELGITTAHNGMDLVNNEEFYLRSADSIGEFNTTARIGIKVGLDKLWRFVVPPDLKLVTDLSLVFLS